LVPGKKKKEAAVKAAEKGYITQRGFNTVQA
jgi:hypothetical protein